MRAGSPTGTVLGRATVPVTGGWDTFQDVDVPTCPAPRSGTTDALPGLQGRRRRRLYDVDDFTFTTG